MTTFADLTTKINQLFGYQPTQDYLLQHPDLLELALMAIARNVTALTQVTTVVNQLFGANYNSSSIVQRPDLLKIGLLAIQTATVPAISFSDLSQIAALLNGFLGTNYTATDVSSSPSLLASGLLLFEQNGVPLTSTRIIAQGCWVGSVPYIFSARQPDTIPLGLMAIAPTSRTSNTLIVGDRWRDTGSSVEYVFDGRGWYSGEAVNLIIQSKLTAKSL